ncbi:hypothetical protein LCGC14_1219380 [marine sediment metagenome]|uniref:Uncharacterized protein n=1 Tax=marine sediment metagenome TaxID=412755 RepID=A0A0F9LFR8_9ZZZZ
MEIFKRFEEDDIVRANPTEVSTGLWTGDTGSLAEFHISAVQTASTAGLYFWDIYNVDPALTSSAEVQFAIAYGHIEGSGSATLIEDDNALLETKATYFQYRNILLEPDDANFTFQPDTEGASFDADEIFVINIQRARLREKLDPGNWLLNLAFESGSADWTHSFIDDSGQTLGESFGTSGRVFNVVSGTLTGVSGSTVVASSSVSGGFGLVYPDLGIIILNPQALHAVSASAITDLTTGANRQNPKVLLDAIIGIGALSAGSASSDTSDFQARSAEDIASTHYFVRLRNKEFNYSNNPSFFNETNGAILNTNFIQDPQVFVTSVGLFNDLTELLAVGKLSQPTRKSFDRELLIRVRLDF